MVIWGAKTVALFDVWSIEHVVSGVNLYCLAVLFVRWRKVAPNWPSVLGVVMALCFAWEALEHYLEVGLAGAQVADWFQGVEFSLNRLVTDPLMIYLGARVARRYPQLHVPAKLFSILWIAAHVALFPDSMYLQRALPEIRHCC